MIRVARRLSDPGSHLPLCDRTLLERELLPDWYDEWVEFERARLRQLRLHALEALAGRLFECGRLNEAIETILVAITNDPLRESAYRLLIKAHLSEGNVAEAVRQYKRYSDLLRRRLNVVPSEAIKELVRPFRIVT